MAATATSRSIAPAKRAFLPSRESAYAASSDGGAGADEGTVTETRAKTGLLDLPNELLETIFSIAHADDYKCDPCAGFFDPILVNKRIWTLAKPVWFRTLEHCPEVGDAHADGFFADLLDRRDETQHIRQLIVTTDEQFSRLHAATVARLPMLSFLRLDCGDSAEPEMSLDRRTFEILSKCPRLVHLDLRGLIDMPEDFEVGLDQLFPTLRHLSISGASRASALLKEPCVGLDSLHLRLEEGDETFPMIPWTSLRYLQLQFYDWSDSLAESFSIDLSVVNSCIEPGDIHLETVHFLVECPPSDRSDEPVSSILTSLLSFISPIRLKTLEIEKGWKYVWPEVQLDTPLENVESLVMALTEPTERAEHDFWPSLGRFLRHFPSLVRLRLRNVSSATIVRCQGDDFLAKIQPLELPLAYPNLAAMLAFMRATSVLDFRLSSTKLRAEVRAIRQSRLDEFVLERWQVESAEMEP